MTRPPSAHAGSAFTSSEWDLLVRLPGQLVVAVTSAEADIPARTVAQALAGIDAIAAGLDSPNLLIRCVVGAIYAERGDGVPVAEEFADRTASLALVVTASRSAGGVLAHRCGAIDQRAYRDWLTTIATRVCEAARSNGLTSSTGVRLSLVDSQFLAEMSAALGG